MYAAIAVRLEIDAGSTPMRGRLTTESGHVAAFTGWVGLAAAIEQVIALGAGLIRPTVDE
jgi:hypothetical protein